MHGWWCCIKLFIMAKLLKKSFKDVWFQPAGDAGGSLGAAKALVYSKDQP